MPAYGHAHTPPLNPVGWWGGGWVYRALRVARRDSHALWRHLLFRQFASHEGRRAEVLDFVAFPHRRVSRLLGGKFSLRSGVKVSDAKRESREGCVLLPLFLSLALHQSLPPSFPLPLPLPSLPSNSLGGPLHTRVEAPVPEPTTATMATHTKRSAVAATTRATGLGAARRCAACAGATAS